MWYKKIQMVSVLCWCHLIQLCDTFYINVWCSLAVHNTQKGTFSGGCNPCQHKWLCEFCDSLVSYRPLNSLHPDFHALLQCHRFPTYYNVHNLSSHYLHLMCLLLVGGSKAGQISMLTVLVLAPNTFTYTQGLCSRRQPQRLGLELVLSVSMPALR